MRFVVRLPSHHENEEIHRDDRPASPIPASFLTGPKRAAARAMLIRLAFKPEDFQKTAHRDCFHLGSHAVHMHIDKLALEARRAPDCAQGDDLNTSPFPTAFDGQRRDEYSLVSARGHRRLHRNGWSVARGMDALSPSAAATKTCRAAYRHARLIGRCLVSGHDFAGCSRATPALDVFPYLNHRRARQRKIGDQEFRRMSSVPFPVRTCGGQVHANTMASAMKPSHEPAEQSARMRCRGKGCGLPARPAAGSCRDAQERSAPATTLDPQSVRERHHVFIALGGSTNARAAPAERSRTQPK